MPNTTQPNSLFAEQKEAKKSMEQREASIPAVKSTVTSVLAEARSLLSNPSRPYTPRDLNRKMFLENEYSVRPSSSYQIKGLFDGNSKLAPVESFKRKKKVCCS